MKLRTLCSALALISGAAAANAADLSTKDSPAIFGPHISNTWTGYYVGINGGYGWDSALNFQDAFSMGGNPVAALETGTRPAGWFYGLSAGADWQFSGIVAGIETDIDMSNIADDSAVKFCATGGGCVPLTGGAVGSSVTHSTIDWFGTLRARLGVPLASNLLPYVTGGLAYGGVSTRSVSSFTSLSGDETKLGWVLGAGVEWRVSPGWSLKSEYEHIDLGSTSITGALPTIAPLGTTASSNSPHNQIDLIKLGLVYKLGSDYTHPTQ